MRVFVTGGTGFIGGHVVQELVASGEEVTCLTRDTKALPRGVRRVKGDLADLHSWVRSIHGHDALVHNAIIWDDEPTELELRDPRASVTLYQATAAAGVKQVLYTSSQAVHRPFSPLMTEDSPIRPGDFYAATKAINESVLFACANEFGFRANVVRPGPTVGAPVPGGGHTSDRRIEEFVRLARAGKDLCVTQGDGRQFTPVANLAQVYAKLLRSNFDQEVFLCCDRSTITWEEIARTVAALTESSSNVVVSLPRARENRFLVDKAEKAFGLDFDAAEALAAHIRHLAERDRDSPFI